MLLQMYARCSMYLLFGDGSIDVEVRIEALSDASLKYSGCDRYSNS